ncbi:hypothetical protein ACTWQB_13465 [Piscibacillus sp. B03]|uniref:hypothetical protein n=1 Tax=Piscibacillus sp. B03 TaxID=3457430 RepID=UPI003FCCFC66
MSVFLTNEEVNRAVDLIVHTYQVPSSMIHQLLGKTNVKQLNKHIEEVSGEGLEQEQLARVIVMTKGAELFKGSDKAVRELRRYLLKQLPDDEVVQLYQRNPDNRKKLCLRHLCTSH